MSGVLNKALVLWLSKSVLGLYFLPALFTMQAMGKAELPKGVLFEMGKPSGETYHFLLIRYSLVTYRHKVLTIPNTGMTEDEGNLIIPEELITQKIYIIRNCKVMLDKDLADFLDVKATRLREQVKRNRDKFPLHFMFQLTDSEADIMVSQNAIPSRQHLGGFLPFVFTEHGVLQLANVLKSKRATQVSIRIIEIFVKMREMLTTTLNIQLDIEMIKLRMRYIRNRVKARFL